MHSNDFDIVAAWIGGDIMNYVVFPHCVKIENKKVKTYGIIVINKIIPIKVFKDISTDYEAIQDLVKRLNDGKVEFVHVDDIIEDFYFDNV